MTAQTALAADNFEWSSLYNAVSHMMARLGADGSISTDAVEVERVMDALHRLDAGQFVPGLTPRPALAQREAVPVAAIIPKERLALNVRHADRHKAADAFWEYWTTNGETHKHGYYESTWGAINRALRTVGVVEHEYPAASPQEAPDLMKICDQLRAALAAQVDELESRRLHVLRLQTYMQDADKLAEKRNADLDRLRAEKDALIKTTLESQVAWEENLERLRAERDALRADAERYRWLRSNCECMGDRPDDAIDAARAQGGTPT